MTDKTDTSQQTAASVGHAADFPITSYLPGSGGLVTSLITAIVGGMWLRRRLSRDSLEVAKDVGEKRLLLVITEERDRAVAAAEAAWATRTEDARLIGQLTSEVKHLSETNRNLISDVSGMRDEITQLKEIIYSLLPPDIAEKMRKASSPPYSKVIRETIAQSELGD